LLLVWCSPIYLFYLHNLSFWCDMQKIFGKAREMELSFYIIF
jgi:hypothetical protein